MNSKNNKMPLLRKIGFFATILGSVSFSNYPLVGKILVVLGFVLLIVSCFPLKKEVSDL